MVPTVSGMESDRKGSWKGIDRGVDVKGKNARKKFENGRGYRTDLFRPHGPTNHELLFCLARYELFGAMPVRMSRDRDR